MSKTDSLPIAVVLGGVDTPLRLAERGPVLGEAHVAAFERELKHRLPDQYRAFLLACNGGVPVVSRFVPIGADAADPDQIVGLRRFRSLPIAPAADDVPGHARLKPSREHPFGLPDDVLDIAEDGSGNALVIRLSGPSSGQVLFVDHEEDLDLDHAPVVAGGILDLLLRFQPEERQNEQERHARDAERATVVRGPFPAALSQLIARTGRDPAVVEAAIRRASLAVCDAKGYFTLHDDPGSHAVYDLIGWLASASREPPGLERDEMHEAMFDWAPETDEGFGLRGDMPGYTDVWWDTRLAQGILEPAGNSKVRLSEKYVDDLFARLR